MDKKQQAIEELKRQIRLAKSRLGPTAVQLLQTALQREQAKPTSPSAPIPYDRESAQTAVELFLARHKDRKGFQVRLAEFIRKSDH